MRDTGLPGSVPGRRQSLACRPRACSLEGHGLATASAFAGVRGSGTWGWSRLRWLCVGCSPAPQPAQLSHPRWSLALAGVGERQLAGGTSQYLPRRPERQGGGSLVRKWQDEVAGRSGLGVCGAKEPPDQQRDWTKSNDKRWGWCYNTMIRLRPVPMGADVGQLAPDRQACPSSWDPGT